MKTNHLITGICLLAIAALSSCGSSSSSGCFGSIPETLAEYEQKSDEITSGINGDNYEKKQKEADELKENTKAEVEKIAGELNGKEISCSVDNAQLTIAKPVTLVFESMNHIRPVFTLGGEVVAAADMTLKADPSDLKGEKLLSGSEVIISVKMPVAVDFLDKDGNVVKHVNDIGTLEAANDGNAAVVKAGTPVDFCRSFTVDESFVGVESIRLAVELDKAPYTSRTLK